MPPRRFINRREGGQRFEQRQPRPNRQAVEDQLLLGLFDDFGDDTIAQSYAPKTNRDLRFNNRRQDAYEDLGLTVDQMEVRGNQVRLSIPETGPTIRLNEKSPGEGDTIRDLADQTLAVTREGEALKVEGRMAPRVGSALIVRDRAGNEKMYAFSRPELETFGRGISGPTGLMQTLPGQQIDREVNEEYLLFAKDKSTNEEVMVAVDTGEPHDLQARRVLRGKSRIIRVKQSQLQQSMTRKASPDQLKKQTNELQYLLKTRRIVYVKKRPLAPQLESQMKNVTTEIDGEKETMRAFVRFDERQPTIIRPVCIEPESSQIDLSTMRAFDADGERECIQVTDPERGQLSYVQEIARNLGRAKLVQEKPGGPVVMPAPVEVQVWSHPESVLPIETHQPKLSYQKAA